MALATVVMAVIAISILRATGAERWQVSLGLVGAGTVLYVVSGALTKQYIERRAPEFASTEESIVKGVQDWEVTAGLGIVPKWVSWLGLFAI
jgi:hypothetical protein